MKELSSRAQELVDAAREADAPKSSDRARIQARLTAALGASAFTAVASQAAAMAAAAAESGAAAGLGSVTSSLGTGAATAAASGAAPIAVASGSSAAAAAGGAAMGLTAAASGTAGVATGAAAAGVATGVAAASGVAGAGWVAALGAKGAAWIGAAALSAAVGTTAVVTTRSHTERSNPAAERSENTTRAVPVRGEQPADVLSARVETASALLPTAADSPVPLVQAAEPSAVGPTVSQPNAVQDRPTTTAARSDSSTRPNRKALRAERKLAAAETSADLLTRDLDAVSAGLAADSSAPSLAAERSASPATVVSSAPINAASPVPVTPEAGAVSLKAASPLSAASSLLPESGGSSSKPAAATRVAAVGSGRVQLSAASKAVRAVAPQPRAALSGELELLAKAQRALHDGKLSLALTLLDQHGAQHAQGALREERMAARAVVLCRMHQVGAGLAEADRLVSQTPRSPLLPWVHQNCKR